MRTLIRGGWVVGFSAGTHCLIPDGTVVLEEDRILYVGRRFDGQADREIDARGRLVSPGFIDTHVHAGHRATSRLLTDTGRRDFFGQPFLEFSVVAPGGNMWGDPRYDARHDRDAVTEAMRLWTVFTVAELLRNGTTTFMETGSQVEIQQHLARCSADLGVRGYLGPGYRSANWVADPQGLVRRVPDEARGQRELAAARDFIRTLAGRREGLIRGFLAPFSVDYCDFALLEATREAARELGVPMQIHASYSVREFFPVVMEYGMTPIEVLAKAGLLGPRMSIGHGNFVAENRLMNYSGGRDLELLASTGTTVAYCPVNLIRRARYLEWEQYRRAGVNMALGTDTYPRDMIMQMRMASYFGKVISGNLFAASAAEVFEAATLGGARALGRDDLGRLAPGAKADVIIVNISDHEHFRYGQVRDPIKNLVEVGIGDDVETVIVDGIVRMERGRIPGVDMRAIGRQVQAVSEEVWAHLPEWDPRHRSVDEIAPWSFPLLT